MKRLTNVFPELLGASSAFAAALERARTASASEIPIFLWGEPGVGKETLARRIAARSERGAKPFVTIRCDRLSPSRAESLFPVRRENGGASLAVSDDALREIGTGTVYFAEIDALSSGPKRRLAKLLEANALPFRTLFGSSRPFPKIRRDGAFPPELESILAAFPIFLPPLRERPDDFVPLATYFFRRAAQNCGVLPRDPSADELEIALKVDFHRNLDDLKRYLKIAIQTGTFPTNIPSRAPSDSAPSLPDQALEFPERAEKRPPRRRASLPSSVVAADFVYFTGAERATPTRENFPTLEEVAKECVAAALRLTDGVVEGPTGAARLLGINPNTLRARMRKMRLDWTKFRPDDAKNEPNDDDRAIDR